MSIIDFKEILHIRRHLSFFNDPTNLYDYVLTQEDLSVGTFKVLGFNINISLGEACSLIDKFAPDLDTAKKAIKELIEKDEVVMEDEF